MESAGHRKSKSASTIEAGLKQLQEQRVPARWSTDPRSYTDENKRGDTCMKLHLDGSIPIGGSTEIVPVKKLPAEEILREVEPKIQPQNLNVKIEEKTSPTMIAVLKPNHEMIIKECSSKKVVLSMPISKEARKIAKEIIMRDNCDEIIARSSSSGSKSLPPSRSRKGSTYCDDSKFVKGSPSHKDDYSSSSKYTKSRGKRLQKEVSLGIQKEANVKDISKQQPAFETSAKADTCKSPVVTDPGCANMLQKLVSQFRSGCVQL